MSEQRKSIIPPNQANPPLQPQATESEAPVQEEKKLNYELPQPEIVDLDPPGGVDAEDEEDIPPLGEIGDLAEAKLKQPDEEKFIYSDNLALQLQLEEYEKFLKSLPSLSKGTKLTTPHSLEAALSIALPLDENKTTATVNNSPGHASTIHTIMQDPNMVSIIASNAGLSDSLNLAKIRKDWKTSTLAVIEKLFRDKSQDMLSHIRQLQSIDALTTYCFINREFAKFVLQQPSQFGITEQDGFFIALSHDLVTNDMKGRVNSGQIKISPDQFAQIAMTAPKDWLASIKANPLTKGDDWAWVDQGINQDNYKGSAEKICQYQDWPVATKFISKTLFNLAFRTLADFEFVWSKPEYRAQFEQSLNASSDGSNRLRMFYIDNKEDINGEISAYILDHPKLKHQDKVACAGYGPVTADAAMHYLKEDPHFFKPAELLQIINHNPAAAAYIANNQELAKQIRVRKFINTDTDMPETWLRLITTNKQLMKIALTKDYLGFDQLERDQIIVVARPENKGKNDKQGRGLAEALFDRYIKNGKWQSPLKLDDWVTIAEENPTLVEKIISKLGKRFSEVQLRRILESLDEKNFADNAPKIVSRIAARLTPSKLKPFLDEFFKSPENVNLLKLYNNTLKWGKDPDTNWEENVKFHAFAPAAIISSTAAKKFTSGQFLSIAKAAIKNHPNVVKFILEAHAKRIDATTQKQLLDLVPQSHYVATQAYLKSLNIIIEHSPNFPKSNSSKDELKDRKGSDKKLSPGPLETSPQLSQLDISKVQKPLENFAPNISSNLTSNGSPSVPDHSSSELTQRQLKIMSDLIAYRTSLIQQIKILEAIETRGVDAELNFQRNLLANVEARIDLFKAQTRGIQNFESSKESVKSVRKAISDYVLDLLTKNDPESLKLKDILIHVGRMEMVGFDLNQYAVDVAKSFDDTSTPTWGKKIDLFLLSLITQQKIQVIQPSSAGTMLFEVQSLEAIQEWKDKEGLYEVLDPKGPLQEAELDPKAVIIANCAGIRFAPVLRPEEVVDMKLRASLPIAPPASNQSTRPLTLEEKRNDRSPLSSGKFERGFFGNQPDTQPPPPPEEPRELMFSMGVAPTD